MAAGAITDLSPAVKWQRERARELMDVGDGKAKALSPRLLRSRHYGCARGVALLLAEAGLAICEGRIKPPWPVVPIGDRPNAEQFVRSFLVGTTRMGRPGGYHTSQQPTDSTGGFAG